MTGRIVALLFLGTLIALVSSWLFASLYGHARSQDWVKSTALVTSIEESNKSATINYKYIFNDFEYTGDNFVFLSAGSVTDKYHILSSYKVGDEVNIFVNLGDPQESVVLKRGIAFEHFSTHVFVIIAALIMGYFIGFKSDENLK